MRRILVTAMVGTVVTTWGAALFAQPAPANASPSQMWADRDSCRQPRSGAADSHGAGFRVVRRGRCGRRCQVAVSYRKKGTSAWREALPLLRINRRDRSGQYATSVEQSHRPNLFAGSVLDLEPSRSRPQEGVYCTSARLTGRAPCSSQASSGSWRRTCRDPSQPITTMSTSIESERVTRSWCLPASTRTIGTITRRARCAAAAVRTAAKCSIGIVPMCIRADRLVHAVDNSGCLARWCLTDGEIESRANGRNLVCSRGL